MPMQLFVDSMGHMYICVGNSHGHAAQFNNGKYFAIYLGTQDENVY